MKKNTLIFIIIVFALIFSIAGLIHRAIEIEFSTGTSVNRVELAILFTVLGILLFGIIVVHLYPGVVQGKNKTTRIVRFGALTGLLLFLTQSIVLFDKTSYIMQSDIAGYAIYNVIELAISRLVIALLYGASEYPSLPAKKN